MTRQPKRNTTELQAIFTREIALRWRVWTNCMFGDRNKLGKILFHNWLWPHCFILKGKPRVNVSKKVYNERYYFWQKRTKRTWIARGNGFKRLHCKIELLENQEIWTKFTKNSALNCPKLLLNPLLTCFTPQFLKTSVYFA